MTRKLSEIFPPCAFRFSTEPQIEAVRKSIYIGFILIDDELSVAPFPEKSMVHVRHEESEEDSDPLPHAYQVGTPLPASLQIFSMLPGWHGQQMSELILAQDKTFDDHGTFLLHRVTNIPDVRFKSLIVPEIVDI